MEYPISVVSSQEVVASSALKQLQRQMDIAGWEVSYIDLNLLIEHPVLTIRCHRHDGLWFWARVDSLGRCQFDTFQRESWLGKPDNARGNWPQSLQIDDLFLGRIRPVGARALMRQLTHYVADNSLNPVGLSDIKQAWAAVMGAPTHFCLEALAA